MCGCAPCGGVGSTGPRPNTAPPPPKPPPKPKQLAAGHATMEDLVAYLPYFANPDKNGSVFIVTLTGLAQNGAPPSEAAERAHVERLADLTASGTLAICGLTDQKEGFMVLLAASREEAESIVRADPLLQCDYYRGYRIIELFGPASADRPASARATSHPPPDKTD